MTGWFSFTGFAKGADNLVFDATVQGEKEAIKAVLEPSGIADDPDVIHLYAIKKEDVERFTNREGLPDADYFVNASQPPHN